MSPISYDDLFKYLKEKDADFDNINQPFYKSESAANLVYEIEGTCLDWKHGWGYLTYLMNELGYVKTKDVVTDEDGSDWWSGVATYVYKPMAELFKSKK